ncbi:MAG TPA: hypothetical protein VF913_05440 [Xanthobacteraceae bacterium]
MHAHPPTEHDFNVLLMSPLAAAYAEAVNGEEDPRRRAELLGCMSGPAGAP